MRGFLAALLIVLLAGAPGVAPAHPDHTLVLIVSADSRVTSLDSIELRKLFIGMTVIHDENRLRPLLNESDSLLKEVFLQNIVSMTDFTYDRRVLRLALQSGHSIPSVYTDSAALVDAVASDPTAVSFAWLHDVQRDRRIKILRVLWSD